MNQFITDGYVRSRSTLAAAVAESLQPADEWIPRPRGPAFRDKVGRTLASIGVGLIRDPATLHDVEVRAAMRAA